MKRESKIYVAGSSGLVGSAIVKKLLENGYSNIITSSSKDLNLTNQFQVQKFFEVEKPEYVFLCAAKCGGIFDNINYPVDYLLDNLNIQNNIIYNSFKYDVKKLMFFASSCIFPKKCLQPIKEEYLLTGELEKTNEPYSVAKIAGIKLCESYQKQYGSNFISVNPCNVYGPNDKFDPMHGHVMSSLIYKIWNANKNNIDKVECFGDGTPRREFIYNEDLADASLFLMSKYDESEMINIGTGIDYEIKEIANIICDVVGYKGNLFWDTSKPNGTMRKVLDVNKLFSFGWKPSISLEEGIKRVVESLEKNNE
jgi:GDP-L-fucose synthase